MQNLFGGNKLTIIIVKHFVLTYFLQFMIEIYAEGNFEDSRTERSLQRPTFQMRYL